MVKRSLEASSCVTQTRTRHTHTHTLTHTRAHARPHARIPVCSHRHAHHEARISRTIVLFVHDSHTYPFTPTIRATLLFTHDGRLRRPVPLLVRVWTAAHIHSRLALLEKMQLSSEAALFSDCRQATHPHMHTCTHRPSRHCHIRSKQPIPRRFTPDQYAEAIKCSNVWTHTHTHTHENIIAFLSLLYQLSTPVFPRTRTNAEVLPHR